eukprot:TRINITY_DN610_c0_g1_i1.p1 TRINITY_DN610_c0_g1~~TRINITY_DN610_c0_g1_i1.p1  ORF type:complete len:2910 (-),score=807.36 TRINITY_DN610_c0_g1_i1:2621-11350(-)
MAMEREFEVPSIMEEIGLFQNAESQEEKLEQANRIERTLSKPGVLLTLRTQLDDVVRELNPFDAEVARPVQERMATLLGQIFALVGPSSIEHVRKCFLDGIGEEEMDEKKTLVWKGLLGIVKSGTEMNVSPFVGPILLTISGFLEVELEFANLRPVFPVIHEVSVRFPKILSEHLSALLRPMRDWLFDTQAPQTVIREFLRVLREWGKAWSCAWKYCANVLEGFLDDLNARTRKTKKQLSDQILVERYLQCVEAILSEYDGLLGNLTQKFCDIIPRVLRSHGVSAIVSLILSVFEILASKERNRSERVRLFQTIISDFEGILGAKECKMWEHAVKTCMKGLIWVRIDARQQLRHTSDGPENVRVEDGGDVDGDDAHRIMRPIDARRAPFIRKTLHGKGPAASSVLCALLNANEDDTMCVIDEMLGGKKDTVPSWKIAKTCQHGILMYLKNVVSSEKIKKRNPLHYLHLLFGKSPQFVATLSKMDLLSRNVLFLASDVFLSDAAKIAEFDPDCPEVGSFAGSLLPQAITLSMIESVTLLMQKDDLSQSAIRSGLKLYGLLIHHVKLRIAIPTEEEDGHIESCVSSSVVTEGVQRQGGIDSIQLVCEKGGGNKDNAIAPYQTYVCSMVKLVCRISSRMVDDQQMLQHCLSCLRQILRVIPIGSLPLHVMESIVEVAFVPEVMEHPPFVWKLWTDVLHEDFLPHVFHSKLWDQFRSSFISGSMDALAKEMDLKLQSKLTEPMGPMLFKSRMMTLFSHFSWPNASSLAHFLVEQKLRSPFGGPHQTFVYLRESIESCLKDLSESRKNGVFFVQKDSSVGVKEGTKKENGSENASKMDSDSSVDDTDGRKMVQPKEEYPETMAFRRGLGLLRLVFELEKQINVNASDFFMKNESVCFLWFTRLRPQALKLAVALGCGDFVVYHHFRMIEELERVASVLELSPSPPPSIIEIFESKENVMWQLRQSVLDLCEVLCDLNMFNAVAGWLHFVSERRRVFFREDYWLFFVKGLFYESKGNLEHAIGWYRAMMRFREVPITLKSRRDLRVSRMMALVSNEDDAIVIAQSMLHMSPFWRTSFQFISWEDVESSSLDLSFSFASFKNGPFNISDCGFRDPKTLLHVHTRNTHFSQESLESSSVLRGEYVQFLKSTSQKLQQRRNFAFAQDLYAKYPDPIRVPFTFDLAFLRKHKFFDALPAWLIGEPNLLTDPQKLFLCAEYAVDKNFDIEFTTHLFDEVLALDPAYAPAHKKFSEFWKSRGDFDRALESDLNYLRYSKDMNPSVLLVLLESLRSLSHPARQRGMTQEHVTERWDDFVGLTGTKLLYIIPQIFAHLRSKTLQSKSFATYVLKRLGEVSPNLLIFPAVFEFPEIAEMIRASDPELVEQVRTLRNQLFRLAHLWEEVWLDSFMNVHSRFQRANAQLKNHAEDLIANKALSSEEKSRIFGTLYRAIMNPVIVVLGKAADATFGSKGPLTVHEDRFCKRFREKIMRVLENLEKPDQEFEKFEFENHFRNLAVAMKGVRAFSRHQEKLRMERVCISPLIPENSRIPVFGEEMSEEYLVKTEAQATILSSKTRPKKLAFIGSEGNVYRYILKAHDDVHLDSRIMQMLDVFNVLLREKISLRTRNYAVIPIGPKAGLIRFVEGTVTLHDICDFGDVSPNEAFINCVREEPLSAQVDLDLGRRSDWPLEMLRNVYRVLLEQNVGKTRSLSRFMMERTSSVSHLLAASRSFARSSAVMSMIGYLLGLGDRHLNNILIDQESFEVVHIDYNVVFDAGKRLVVPEMVPFRFTPVMRRALLFGGQNYFQRICEKTMSIVRHKENRDILLSLITWFSEDPLIDWRVSRKFKKPEEDVFLSLFVCRVDELRPSFDKMLRFFGHQNGASFVKMLKEQDRRVKEVLTIEQKDMPRLLSQVAENRQKEAQDVKRLGDVEAQLHRLVGDILPALHRKEESVIQWMELSMRKQEEMWKSLLSISSNLQFSRIVPVSCDIAPIPIIFSTVEQSNSYTSEFLFLRQLLIERMNLFESINSNLETYFGLINAYHTKYFQTDLSCKFWSDSFRDLLTAVKKERSVSIESPRSIRDFDFEGQFQIFQAASRRIDETKEFCGSCAKRWEEIVVASKTVAQTVEVMRGMLQAGKSAKASVWVDSSLQSQTEGVLSVFSKDELSIAQVLGFFRSSLEAKANMLMTLIGEPEKHVGGIMDGRFLVTWPAMERVRTSSCHIRSVLKLLDGGMQRIRKEESAVDLRTFKEAHAVVHEGIVEVARWIHVLLYEKVPSLFDWILSFKAREECSCLCDGLQAFVAHLKEQLVAEEKEDRNFPPTHRSWYDSGDDRSRSRGSFSHGVIFTSSSSFSSFLSGSEDLGRMDTHVPPIIEKSPIFTVIVPHLDSLRWEMGNMLPRGVQWQLLIVLCMRLSEYAENVRTRAGHLGHEIMIRALVAFEAEIVAKVESIFLKPKLASSLCSIIRELVSRLDEEVFNLTSIRARDLSVDPGKGRACMILLDNLAKKESYEIHDPFLRQCFTQWLRYDDALRSDACVFEWTLHPFVTFRYAYIERRSIPDHLIGQRPKLVARIMDNKSAVQHLLHQLVTVVQGMRVLESKCRLPSPAEHRAKEERDVVLERVMHELRQIDSFLHIIMDIEVRKFDGRVAFEDFATMEEEMTKLVELHGTALEHRRRIMDGTEERNKCKERLAEYRKVGQILSQEIESKNVFVRSAYDDLYDDLRHKTFVGSQMVPEEFIQLVQELEETVTALHELAGKRIILQELAKDARQLRDFVEEYLGHIRTFRELQEDIDAMFLSQEGRSMQIIRERLEEGQIAMSALLSMTEEFVQGVKALGMKASETATEVYQKGEEEDPREQEKQELELRDYVLGAVSRVRGRLDGVIRRDDRRQYAVPDVVNYLIREATNVDNLCRMYEGWCSWV